MFAQLNQLRSVRRHKYNGKTHMDYFRVNASAAFLSPSCDVVYNKRVRYYSLYHVKRLPWCNSFIREVLSFFCLLFGERTGCLKYDTANCADEQTFFVKIAHCFNINLSRTPVYVWVIGNKVLLHCFYLIMFSDNQHCCQNIEILSLRASLPWEIFWRTKRWTMRPLIRLFQGRKILWPIRTLIQHFFTIGKIPTGQSIVTSDIYCACACTESDATRNKQHELLTYLFLPIPSFISLLGSTINWSPRSTTFGVQWSQLRVVFQQTDWFMCGLHALYTKSVLVYIGIC